MGRVQNTRLGICLGLTPKAFEIRVWEICPSDLLTIGGLCDVSAWFYFDVCVLCAPVRVAYWGENRWKVVFCSLSNRMNARHAVVGEKGTERPVIGKQQSRPSVWGDLAGLRGGESLPFHCVASHTGGLCPHPEKILLCYLFFSCLLPSIFSAFFLIILLVECWTSQIEPLFVLFSGIFPCLCF